jgi:phosphatidylserine decarboxylase
MTLLDTFRLVLAPPHRAATPFLAGAGVLALLGLLLWGPLFWLAVLFALFCLYFFRDPERVPPGRPGVVLSPADGRVIGVAPAVPPAELGLPPAPVWRVSVFLSVLDVHVNRVPADGTVARIAYRHGAYVNAALDKASEANERNAVVLRLPDGRELAFVQIAGLVARRIVCELREGDAVRAGDRFGIIRFGSRMDVYLPPGVAPLAAEGQTMIGGESIIAELAA